MQHREAVDPRVDDTTRGGLMAIAVYLHPPSMGAEQYDEIVRRLDEAGAATPPGRLHHSCFGTGNALMMYEIWDSQEAFAAYAETLGPIVQAAGVQLAGAHAMPVHNMID
jgi:hypothetical protein